MLWNRNKTPMVDGAKVIFDQYNRTRQLGEEFRWCIHPQVWRIIKQELGGNSDKLFGIPVDISKNSYGILLARKKVRNRAKAISRSKIS